MRIKLWLTKLHLWPRPVHPLLKQWREARAADQLLLLVVQRLLVSPSPSLEASKADAPGRMASSLARLKRWRRIAPKTLSASAVSASANKPPPPPRRPLCPRPVRHWLVRQRRRLLIWGLCQGLRGIRLCLGIRRCCNRSLSSSRRPPRKWPSRKSPTAPSDSVCPPS